jgi:hypothetical protein
MNSKTVHRAKTRGIIGQSVALLLAGFGIIAAVAVFICMNATTLGCGESDKPVNPAVSESHPHLVVFQGVIDDTRAQMFKDLLEQTKPNARLIELASMGGELSASERIAKDIDASGLPVRVSILCGSACVRLFTSVPQDRRLATPEALFWFHHGKPGKANQSCSACALIGSLNNLWPGSFNPKLMLEWAKEISPRLPEVLDRCEAFASPGGAALTWQEIQAIDRGETGPNCDEMKERNEHWAARRARSLPLPQVPADLVGSS